jgi:hypothetical protein
MRKTRFRWAVFYTLLTTLLSCRTPSPNWNSTWTLDASKSNFQGTIFSISISANGEYRWSDGGASFTFRCDGKYRPIGKDRTQACVKSTSTALDMVRKEDGVKTNAYHWELSDGGKVLKSTETVLRPSGPIIGILIVASRLSGSGGFAGQWRDTGYLQQHATMALRLDSQALHIGYPSAEQYVDAPLNGADAPLRGPHAPDGVTWAIKRTGQREFFVLTKRNGTVLTQGSLELGSDGKVLTDSWWSPSRPSDKATLVYERK